MKVLILFLSLLTFFANAETLKEPHCNIVLPAPPGGYYDSITRRMKIINPDIDIIQHKAGANGAIAPTRHRLGKTSRVCLNS